MQQYTDNNGHKWGDIGALQAETGISTGTADKWRANGVFEESTHFVQTQSGLRTRIFYHLSRCKALHEQRVKAHKDNLRAGAYRKKATANAKKMQVNLTISAEEKELLELLQESGKYMRVDQINCGDVVLRSESQPLSLTSIAAELFRRSLEQENERLFGKEKTLNKANA